mgnify:CR=1 FL=1|tara:strand:+ start:306 stop:743 length:438 start_codon:yes stop_codon:yes gene_type:complete
MKKLLFLIFILNIFSYTQSTAKESFFEEAKNKYDNEQMEDSKFLFQRNITFNPKHAKSYLYLAKIYNTEENEFEELKNIKTVLLLDPENEEAMYMLINIELEKSNFSEVNNLTEKFKIICSKLCSQTESIKKKLEDIEVKENTKK